MLIVMLPTYGQASTGVVLFVGTPSSPCESSGETSTFSGHDGPSSQTVVLGGCSMLPKQPVVSTNCVPVQVEYPVMVERPIVLAFCRKQLAVYPLRVSVMHSSLELLLDLVEVGAELSDGSVCRVKDGVGISGSPTTTGGT